MKILVCGDRNWTVYWRIHNYLVKVRNEFEIEWDNVTLIHGGCKGADEMAGQFAIGAQVERIIIFPAQWHRYGLSAGPIRNRQMLDLEPDIVIAFHNNIKESKGTADTVNEARRRGIPTRVIKEVEE